MIVETHAFKRAFVRGEASGFVVCVEPPHSPKRLFAEIYGTPDCYHIFEARRAAEFQMSLVATGTPPRDDLTVTEVRVDNIRDYQLLAGFKTVFLVDGDGRLTQSLRVGDMPLAARTDAPFPQSATAAIRFALNPKPLPAPSVPPVTPVSSGTAFIPLHVRRRPRLDLSDLTTSDPTPAVEYPTSPRSPRPLDLVRRLFRKILT